MLYKVLFILAVLCLNGCATLQRIVDYGAAANSTAVESSIFTVCQGASVGAIRREFNTPEKVRTWKALCNDTTEFEP